MRIQGDEMEECELKNSGIPFLKRETLVPWRRWGDELEDGALKQMENACLLPIAVTGALMPDAHQGYGEPQSGQAKVLLVRGIVISR